MSVILFYDRGGVPISMEEWSSLLGTELYRRVAWTEIGPYVVSTVWLGLDHSHGSGPPMIFESMVFTASEWNERYGRLLDIDVMRYSTEEEAHRGHDELVTLIRATHRSVEEAMRDEQQGEHAPVLGDRGKPELRPEGGQSARLDTEGREAEGGER